MGLIKWYKRDPDAALNGMMSLSLEERGAYNTVLDLIYSRDGNLEDDDRFISGWLRCDLRVWRRIKTRLIEAGKIEAKHGLIVNFRATSEIDEALSKIGSASELGRIKGVKSGIKRRENKDLSEPAVQPKTNTPTPTPKEYIINNPTPTAAREIVVGEVSLETKLRKAAGWESEPAPMLAVTGPIEALIEAGCSLEVDILPTVKAIASRVSARTTWNYFIKPIQKAYADRVEAKLAPGLSVTKASSDAAKEEIRKRVEERNARIMAERSQKNGVDARS